MPAGRVKPKPKPKLTFSATRILTDARNRTAPKPKPKPIVVVKRRPAPKPAPRPAPIVTDARARPRPKPKPKAAVVARTVAVKTETRKERARRGGAILATGSSFLKPTKIERVGMRYDERKRQAEARIKAAEKRPYRTLVPTPELAKIDRAQVRNDRLVQEGRITPAERDRRNAILAGQHRKKLGKLQKSGLVLAPPKGPWVGNLVPSLYRTAFGMGLLPVLAAKTVYETGKASVSTKRQGFGGYLKDVGRPAYRNLGKPFGESVARVVEHPVRSFKEDPVGTAAIAAMFVGGVSGGIGRGAAYRTFGKTTEALGRKAARDNPRLLGKTAAEATAADYRALGRTVVKQMSAAGHVVKGAERVTRLKTGIAVPIPKERPIRGTVPSRNYLANEFLIRRDKTRLARAGQAPTAIRAQTRRGTPTPRATAERRVGKRFSPETFVGAKQEAYREIITRGRLAETVELERYGTTTRQSALRRIGAGPALGKFGGKHLTAQQNAANLFRATGRTPKEWIDASTNGAILALGEKDRGAFAAVLWQMRKDDPARAQALFRLFQAGQRRAREKGGKPFGTVEEHLTRSRLFKKAEGHYEAPTAQEVRAYELARDVSRSATEREGIPRTAALRRLGAASREVEALSKLKKSPTWRLEEIDHELKRLRVKVTEERLQRHIDAIEKRAPAGMPRDRIMERAYLEALREMEGEERARLASVTSGQRDLEQLVAAEHRPVLPPPFRTAHPIEPLRGRSRYTGREGGPIQERLRPEPGERVVPEGERGRVPAPLRRKGATSPGERLVELRATYQRAVDQVKERLGYTSEKRGLVHELDQAEQREYVALQAMKKEDRPTELVFNRKKADLTRLTPEELAWWKANVRGRYASYASNPEYLRLTEKLSDRVDRLTVLQAKARRRMASKLAKEQGGINATNAERARKGLPPLETPKQRHDAAAQEHAETVLREQVAQAAAPRKGPHGEDIPGDPGARRVQAMIDELDRLEANVPVFGSEWDPALVARYARNAPLSRRTGGPAPNFREALDALRAGIRHPLERKPVYRPGQHPGEVRGVGGRLVANLERAGIKSPVELERAALLAEARARPVPQAGPWAARQPGTQMRLGEREQPLRSTHEFAGFKRATQKQLFKTPETPSETYRRLLREEKAIEKDLLQHGREVEARGGFYVTGEPYGPARGSTAAPYRGQPAPPGPTGISPPLEPTRHPYSGSSIRTGLQRTDVTNAVVDKALESHYRQAKIDGYTWALSMSVPKLQDVTDPAYAVPIRVIRQRRLGHEMRQFAYGVHPGPLSEGELTAIQKLRKQLSEKLGEEVSIDDAELAHLFPIHLKGTADPNIRYVDIRYLGHLLQNDRTGMLWSGLNAINSIARASILWGQGPKYIVNLFQNLGTAALREGPFIIPNMLLYRRLPLDLQVLISETMGGGRSLALSPEKGPLAHSLQATARFWNAVTDQPVRNLAFIHEARAKGFNTPEKISNLLTLKRYEKERVEIAQRADYEAIPFNRMSPFEQTWIKQAIIFYPWLRGASIYVARFPVEHPIETGVLTPLAQESYDRYAAKGLPSFLQGSTRIGGWYYNPRSINTFETPVELGRAAAGLLQGRTAFANEAMSLLSPVAGAVTTGITGVNPLGFEVPAGTPRYIAVANQLGQSIPLSQFFRKGRKEGGLVTGGWEAAARGALGGQLAGYQLDEEKKKEIRREEILAGMSPPERVIYERGQAVSQLHRLGPRLGVPKEVIPRIELAIKLDHEKLYLERKFMEARDTKAVPPATRTAIYLTVMRHNGIKLPKGAPSPEAIIRHTEKLQRMGGKIYPPTGKSGLEQATSDAAWLWRHVVMPSGDNGQTTYLSEWKAFLKDKGVPKYLGRTQP